VLGLILVEHKTPRKEAKSHGHDVSGTRRWLHTDTPLNPTSEWSRHGIYQTL
jgi:hypothetical protein